MFEAFWELGTDRHIGMVEGPIPWSAINAFAVDLGLDADGRRRFKSLIRALDREYMTIKAEKPPEAEQPGDENLAKRRSTVKQALIARQRKQSS